MSAQYAPIQATRIRPAHGWIKDRHTCPRCGIDFTTSHPQTHCKDCRHYVRRTA
jgi:hypothetical protein